MGSESDEKLRKILREKTLLADLEHMTEQVNTTMLEVFHAVKIAYLPKKTFLGIEKMIAGTQIAALHHNHNANREQVQKTVIFFSPEFCYQYQLNLQCNLRETRESFTSLQDDIVNLSKIT